MTVTSLRTIKAGEEVLNYYGPHPNSELLRRYGYVTPKHSRYDVVEIPWEVVEASLKNELSISDENLSKIRERTDKDELEDTFVLERESGEPKSDGTFAGPATLTEMPGDLLEQLKIFLKAVKKIDPESIPDKRKRDDVMQAILAQSLHALESRYPTNATDDESLLRKEGVSQRQRMAIEVRRGEKKLLEEAKEMLLGGAQDGPSDPSSGPKRARLAS